MRSKTVAVLLVAALTVLSFSLAACSSTSGDGAQTETSPTAAEVEPKGAQLVEEKCPRCHGLGPVEAADKDATQWETTVERMKTNGLQVTDAEFRAIVDYLAERDSRR